MSTPSAKNSRDYYEILGVTRTATTKEVRLAFRNLARKYHPDIARNTAGAEDRFKEISVAYDVLGDPKKRERYDKLGHKWNDKSPFHPFEREGNDTADFQYTETSFSEFFEQNFGHKNPGPAGERPAPPPAPEVPPRPEPEQDRGRDLEATLILTREEAARGSVHPITLRYKVTCPRCNGEGLDCQKCRGKGKMYRKSSYSVKIPAGVTHGAVLRLRGRGEKFKGGESGDLYLTLRVGNQPLPQAPPAAPRPAQGPRPAQATATPASDISTQPIVLAPWEAVLGCEVKVKTPGGKTVVTIPPGCQVGQHVDVPGMGPGGAPHALIVDIEIPTRMTRTEHELWQEIAKRTKFRPRK